MTDLPKICLWQHSPSLHQIALIKGLRKKSNLTWILESEITANSRKKMGWDNGGIYQDYILSPENLHSIINKYSHGFIHIFGGTRASPLLRKAYKSLLKKKVLVYVQTEAPNYFGLVGKLKLVRGIYENFTEYKQLEGIFAIGSLGLHYYKLIGYPSNKTFPFGYFMENKEINLNKTSDSSPIFKIIFIGRLIKTKGVLVLLKSIKRISFNYSLTIIGNGPEEKSIKDFVVKNNYLKDKVIFYDFMNNEDVLIHLKQSDLLVLPSINKDGWGAVVSESLMQGTPVITTNKCGSSILLNKNYLGSVVKANSIKSLQLAIETRIKQGKINQNQRDKIIHWSKCLDGNVAAQYMLDCIKGMNPNAPWN